MERWQIRCSGLPMFQVTEKIKATRVHLLKWVKSTERYLPAELAATEDKLNCLFGQPFTKTSIAQRNDLYTKLHSLLAQVEAFWRQRARENWMRIGDINMKFFHQKSDETLKAEWVAWAFL